jgi:branched chain amino acid efflux pump
VINQQPAADNIETLMIMPHDTPRDVWTGARDVSPLAAGVAIYGLAFGLLAAQAGFVSFQVGVMGAIVFAGGSQIVAVQQLVADAGAGAAIVAGLALNLRLLLVTASIRDIYADRPWWQVALGAHVTTDENWARQRPERRLWYLVGGGRCLVLVGALRPWQALSLRELFPNRRLSGWTSRSRPLSSRLHDRCGRAAPISSLG